MNAAQWMRRVFCCALSRLKRVNSIAAVDSEREIASSLDVLDLLAAWRSRAFAIEFAAWVADGSLVRFYR
jgi:hypothetical protein